MTWRVAKSLDVLLEQINELAPERSKISDGSIGDPRHAAAMSDHNPNASGVVCARDFTHDPANGADMNLFGEALRESTDDRLKYVIWDREMFSSYPTSGHAAFSWRPYSGSNPHDKHMHVSVHGDYDDTRPWQIGEEMAISEEDWRKLRKMVREEITRLAVGKSQKNYDPDKVNLKRVLDKLGDKKNA